METKREIVAVVAECTVVVVVVVEESCCALEEVIEPVRHAAVNPVDGLDAGVVVVAVVEYKEEAEKWATERQPRRFASAER